MIAFFIWVFGILVTVFIAVGLLNFAISLQGASRLDAGIEAVRALRDRVEFLAYGSAQLKDNTKLIYPEVQGILKEIDTDLPSDLRDMLTLMSSTAETTCQDLAAVLTTLERYLQMQKGVILARTAIWPLLKARHQPPEHKSPTFVGSEAELLVGVTEKFYGSASFKALGIALTAAVLLAGSGAFFIGSQSVNLRDNLKQTAEEQEKSLKQAAEEQRKNLEQQQGSIKAQSDAAQKAITSYQTLAGDANAKLQDTIKTFETGSKELEKKAAEAVVGSVKAALEVREKELSTQLEIAEQAVAQPLEEAKKRLNKVQSDVAHLEEKIRETTAIEPKIDQLKSAVSAVDQINQVKANQGIVALAASDAQAQLKMAQNAWDSLKTLNGGLDARQSDIGKLTQRANDQGGQLDTLAKDLFDMQKTRDEAKGKLMEFASLQVDVTSAAAALATIGEDQNKADEAATETRKNAETGAKLDADLQSRIDKINPLLAQISQASDLLARLAKVETLAQRVDNLEQKMQKLEPIPAKEAHVTRDELWKIQTTLRKRGFYRRKVDGKPGPYTQDAIREYQKQRPGQPAVTGALAEDQKADLLNTAPVATSPSP